LSTALRPRLLVDVTQYVSWPATSGVQRVLRHLAEDWPGQRVEARFGFIEHGRYVTGPIAELGYVIGSTFRGCGHLGIEARSGFVRRALRETVSAAISIREIETSFDAYLLPEPSLRQDNIAIAARLLESRRTTAFFVYYDALPLTHPQFFPPAIEREAPLIRYNRTVSRSDNVAFISSATRRVFEARIARRSPQHAIVARLGADGLKPMQSRQPDMPTFTIVGTIERRKRHLVVLNAFEQLWAAGHDYRLVVIGPPGSDTGLIERLRKHSRTTRVTWIEMADDDEIAIALSRSSAMVFISEAEGYGLPPLEALALGCPVIVAEGLPALEGLSSAGQLRLGTVTEERIGSAVRTLADPASNAAYRRAIEDLRLPTWERFAARVEQWVASVLSNEGGGNRHD
jgi:glycosyltransferase involved in cell wall biosynthesis